MIWRASQQFANLHMNEKKLPKRYEKGGKFRYPTKSDKVHYLNLVLLGINPLQNTHWKVSCE